jgi:hypothetical protein
VQVIGEVEVQAAGQLDRVLAVGAGETGPILGRQRRVRRVCRGRRGGLRLGLHLGLRLGLDLGLEVDLALQRLQLLLQRLDLLLQGLRRLRRLGDAGIGYRQRCAHQGATGDLLFDRHCQSFSSSRPGSAVSRDDVQPHIGPRPLGSRLSLRKGVAKMYDL